MAKYIGVDLGGTTISAVIYDKKLLSHDRILTSDESVGDTVAKRIAFLIKRILKDNDTSLEEISGIGIGIPGMVESKAGKVIFAPSVGFERFDLIRELKKNIKNPVYIFNDVQCAAFAEKKIKSNHDKSFLFFTIGTSIGGAFVGRDTFYDRFGNYGAELCHIPFRKDGIPCSCGIPGCFCQYVSANALVYQALDVIKDNPDTKIWDICGHEKDKLTAHMLFDKSLVEDETAVRLIDTYTSYLAEGMGGLTNIFRPDKIIIGGGVSNAKDKLINPIKNKLKNYIYASDITTIPNVEIAKEGDRSGAIGAALLAGLSVEADI